VSNIDFRLEFSKVSAMNNEYTTGGIIDA
jgi:hypothetical protein